MTNINSLGAPRIIVGVDTHRGERIGVRKDGLLLPSGAAMDRLYKFALRAPGGLKIPLGGSYQMTFLRD